MKFEDFLQYQVINDGSKAKKPVGSTEAAPKKRTGVGRASEIKLPTSGSLGGGMGKSIKWTSNSKTRAPYKTATDSTPKGALQSKNDLKIFSKMFFRQKLCKS